MSHAKSGFSSKMPSQRQLKVGENLRHALSLIMSRGDVYDPRLETAFVTISEVRVSPDLRNATVYFLPLAGQNAQAVLEAIQEHEGEIRRLAAKKVVLRYMPHFTFKLDKSFEEASKINTILKKPEVQADLADTE